MADLTAEEIDAVVVAMTCWRDRYNPTDPTAMFHMQHPAVADALRSIGRALWLAGRAYGYDQAQAERAAAEAQESECRDRDENAAMRARSTFR